MREASMAPSPRGRAMRATLQVSESRSNCGEARSRRPQPFVLPLDSEKAQDDKDHAMTSDRWVTFDCFGTLVDWHSGYRRVLSPIAGSRTDALILAYHEFQ